MRVPIYGKDYLTGLKAGLGADGATKIVAEASYELSYPTIDSEILKASGADTLIHFTTPKFAAQGIKKANELNWKPVQFLALAEHLLLTQRAGNL